MPKNQKSRTKDMYDGDARHPGCALSKNFNPVELPEQIVAAAAKGTLTVFAGAGISTESRIVFPYSFYDEIRDALPKGTPRDLRFSELMTRFCSQPDGRRQLLQRLRDRFAYIDSFPELSRLATRFHQELATLPHLDNIITTNWDDYFERFCGATAFVTPQDFVFWNMPGRKVFKIHGSVTNYGSLIATDDDYEKCYRDLRSGLVGSNLRMLLALK